MSNFIHNDQFLWELCGTVCVPHFLRHSVATFTFNILTLFGATLLIFMLWLSVCLLLTISSVVWGGVGGYAGYWSTEFWILFPQKFAATLNFVFALRPMGRKTSKAILKISRMASWQCRMLLLVMLNEAAGD